MDLEGTRHSAGIPRIGPQRSYVNCLLPDDMEEAIAGSSRTKVEGRLPLSGAASSPEAKATDQPTCNFRDVGHAEAGHDPLKDAGGGPARRFANILVGSELRLVVTPLLRFPSSICGRGGQAVSRRPSGRAQLKCFTQSHRVWTSTPWSQAISARKRSPLIVKVTT